MTLKKYLWPVVGGATIAVCAWLLYKELRGLSLDDVWESLSAISLVFFWIAFAAWLLVVIAGLLRLWALGKAHLPSRHGIR